MADLPEHLQRLWERQERELGRLDAKQMRRVLAVFKRASETLKGRVRALEAGGLGPGDEPTPWTAQQYRALEVQMRLSVARIQRELGVVLDDGQRRAAEASLRHAVETFEAAGGRDAALAGVGSPLPADAMRGLARDGALEVHRVALARYGRVIADQMQRQLEATLATGGRGDDFTEAVDRVLHGRFGRQRAALIARMEVTRLYDTAHAEAIDLAARATDVRGDPDPMLQRIQEFYDGRNHPFSRAANGTTARVGEPFRVAVAKVEAQALAMRRRATGILWRREGAFYVGDSMPAHFNDRGRRVPWRASWAN